METRGFTIKEGAEQSKREEERAQRAVCAGQRQLPCNPGDHSTGQRRQGRAVHTGKHYRMRQRHTSAPGACVVQRARRRAEGKRRWRFDRSRVGGALLLLAPFWLYRRGTDVMTRGDCSNGVPKATAKAPVKRWKKERRGEEKRREEEGQVARSLGKLSCPKAAGCAATREQGQGERTCGVQ